jgi:TonB family protein
MHLRSTWLCIAAAVSHGSLGLHAAPAIPETGDRPAAILARAWPLYDFTDPSLKPWHMSVSYLLFDENGKNPQPGVYEYWWVSPSQSRSTWMRRGLRHTDWHSSNGRLAYEEKGDPLTLFEYELEAALIAPLPGARELDPAKFRLKADGVKEGESCLKIVPIDGPGGGHPDEVVPDGAGQPGQPSEPGLFPMYCFETRTQALRSVYSFERVLTQYSNVQQTQGRYLARSVTFLEGDKKLLTAKVEKVERIGFANPALHPPRTAMRTEVFVSRDVSLKDANLKMEETQLMHTRKTEPVYPEEARKAGIEGKVELVAMIGTDGKIHDLQVVSAPAASLAAASFAAVSQWEYRPYFQNDRPVPVQTTITVTFSINE